MISGHTSPVSSRLLWACSPGAGVCCGSQPYAGRLCRVPLFVSPPRANHRPASSAFANLCKKSMSPLGTTGKKVKRIRSRGVLGILAFP